MRTLTIVVIIATSWIRTKWVLGNEGFPYFTLNSYPK